jgi:hypothetical protein
MLTPHASRPSAHPADDEMRARRGRLAPRLEGRAGWRIATDGQGAAPSLRGGAVADAMRVKLEMGPRGKMDHAWELEDKNLTLAARRA